MPIFLQGKLLRVLEERVFCRTGGTQEVFVDVRIIAATNSDLGKKVKQGGFRKDLFHRLNTARIHVPPLRERKEDILPLAQEFLHSMKLEAKRPGLGLTMGARKSLLNHNWPGNIRELKNLMEKAVYSCEGGEIHSADLGLDQGGKSVPAKENGRPIGKKTREIHFSAQTLNLQQLEKDAVRTALEKCDYVQKKAAVLLGLSESQMTYRLNKLSLHHPNFRAKRRRATSE